MRQSYAKIQFSCDFHRSIWVVATRQPRCGTGPRRATQRRDVDELLMTIICILAALQARGEKEIPKEAQEPKNGVMLQLICLDHTTEFAAKHLQQQAFRHPK